MQCSLRVLLGAGLVSVALSGCGSGTNAFRAVDMTDNVKGTYGAHSYALPGAGGKATVWSEGARVDGIDVRIRVQNRTSAPLNLDVADTRLDLELVGGGRRSTEMPPRVR